MIVPDSIEPYVGWKALRVDTDGRLYSPQQTFCWSIKERSEASCGGGPTFRWVPRKGLPPTPERDPRRIIVHPSAAAKISMITHTATHYSPVTAPFATTTALGPIVYSEAGAPEETPPATLLPEGMHWSWEPYIHEAASSNGCTCGIYMVNSPGQCAFYLDSTTLLAQVYGWGHVIVAEKGARVQYAYPKLLIAPEDLRLRAESAAELYEVPVQIMQPGEGPVDFDAPTPNVMTALAQISTSSAHAQAAFLQANAALANFNNRKAVPAKQEPLSPFIGFALLGLVGAIISSIALVFTWHGPAGSATLYGLIGSGVLMMLMLLIDFMVFCAQQKSKGA